MKTLLALGTALCLAAASAPARADTLSDLQARARSERLADDPAWSDLLQYEPYPFTGQLRSLADDRGFFNAPDGARNPARPWLAFKTATFLAFLQERLFV